MWNKLRKFYSLPPRLRGMYIEAFFLLGWARLMKSLPFSRIAPSIGVLALETSFTPAAGDEAVLREVSRAIRTMSRHTFWESHCLVMAIAGMKMLERRRIASTLYLGTAREPSGQMIAHAWLRSGSMYVTGAEGRKRFTVVGVFGKQTIQGQG